MVRFIQVPWKMCLNIKYQFEIKTRWRSSLLFCRQLRKWSRYVLCVFEVVKQISSNIKREIGFFSPNRNIFSFTVNMFCWNQVNGSTISYSKLATVKQSWATMKIFHRLISSRVRDHGLNCFGFWFFIVFRIGLDWIDTCFAGTWRAALLWDVLGCQKSKMFQLAFLFVQEKIFVSLTNAGGRIASTCPPGYFWPTRTNCCVDK